MKSSHLPSLPMSTSTIVTQMESVLSATLTDLHIRNEVGDCIQEMLMDIETTHDLQQQIELETARRSLEKAQREQQGVILEAHTERLERHNRRVLLADNFAVELLKLNREMKELVEWKEAHEYKVRNYDSMLAKLTQAEEDLRDAKRISSSSDAPQRQTDDNKADEVESSTKKDVEQSPSTEKAPEQINIMSDGTAPGKTVENVPAETATMTKEGAKPSEEELIEINDNQALAEQKEESQNMEAQEEDQKLPATDPAVVSIDVEADVEEDVPTILTLDVEPLMMVFGFLDAMDILNTAQINLVMYNKVDNIFGISEDGQSPPAPTPSKPKQKPAEAKSTAIHPPVAASSSNVATSAAQPTHQKSNSTASIGSATGVMGKGLFAMLTPAKAEAAVSPSAKAPSSNPSSAQQQSQPLNAKVAQSMASKLSDAELAAIISMTDKLSKLEKEIHVLKNEKEVYAGKLEGTEAVKQFLIGKVRDVEVKLQRSKEDEIKVTQQIASDQEVIAFLDSRVQELEQQTENLTLEKTGTQAGFDDLKVSTSKKITMLSDMLKYEREKVREDESDWKATKKVLVKEVKSCRAQILALQAERDGLKEQNDMLKRAIVSTGSGGSSSGKHHNSSGGGRSPRGSPKT